MGLINVKVPNKQGCSFNIVCVVIESLRDSLHPVNDAEFTHDIIDVKIYCPLAYLQNHGYSP